MRLFTAVGVCAAFLFLTEASAQLNIPGSMPGSGAPEEGPQPVRITSSPAFESYPAWSPDGRSIAFARYERGVQKIFIVEVDADAEGMLQAGEERQVTRGAGIDARPCWVLGPAGDVLVFCSNRSGYWQVYTIEVAAGLASEEAQAQPLKEARAPAWNPAWSGDASRLAFVRGHDIYTSALDGREVRLLPTLTGHNDWPAWSPDGGSLVYTGDSDLWVTEVRSEPRDAKTLPLTQRAWNGHAAWTTRGNRIAYVSTAGDNYDIWVLEASGMTVPVQATFDVGREAFPSWSRDGEWVCYASDRNADGTARAGYDIWAIRAPAIAGAAEGAGVAVGR